MSEKIENDKLLEKCKSARHFVTYTPCPPISHLWHVCCSKFSLFISWCQHSAGREHMREGEEWDNKKKYKTAQICWEVGARSGAALLDTHETKQFSLLFFRALCEKLQMRPSKNHINFAQLFLLFFFSLLTTLCTEVFLVVSVFCFFFQFWILMLLTFSFFAMQILCARSKTHQNFLIDKCLKNSILQIPPRTAGAKQTKTWQNICTSFRLLLFYCQYKLPSYHNRKWLQPAWITIFE